MGGCPSRRKQKNPPSDAVTHRDHRGHAKRAAGARLFRRPVLDDGALRPSRPHPSSRPQRGPCRAASFDRAYGRCKKSRDLQSGHHPLKHGERIACPIRFALFKVSAGLTHRVRHMGETILGWLQDCFGPPERTDVASRPRKTLSAADFGVIWAIERIWSCRDLRLMGEKAGNFVCGVAAALSSNWGL